MKKNTLSIMVVDDDQIVRFIHKKVVESLTEFDVTYYEAINGFEALRTIKTLAMNEQKMPDIILLDINMPIMDGFEFIKTFQDLDIPGKDLTEIMIVSSSDNFGDQKRGFALGVNIFLTKPVSKVKLQSAIIEHAFCYSTIKLRVA